MAKDGGQPDDRESKDARRAVKELRKHLKRLEGELATASKAEKKRLRKLEKARWRRQRIQAFIDEARAIAEMETGVHTAAAPAAKPAAPAAKPAAPVAAPAATSQPAPAPRRRVWPSARKTPAASPEKPAP